MWFEDWNGKERSLSLKAVWMDSIWNVSFVFDKCIKFLQINYHMKTTILLKPGEDTEDKITVFFDSFHNHGLFNESNFQVLVWDRMSQG